MSWLASSTLGLASMGHSQSTVRLVRKNKLASPGCSLVVVSTLSGLTSLRATICCPLSPVVSRFDLMARFICLWSRRCHRPSLVPNAWCEECKQFPKIGRAQASGRIPADTCLTTNQPSTATSRYHSDTDSHSSRHWVWYDLNRPACSLQSSRV